MYENQPEKEQHQSYKKAISIVNLGQSTITPKPGQGFSAFTVYELYGNDGLKYETPNYQWFSQRKIGENLTIQYYVDSKKGNGGKVWSHYKLITPASQNPGPTASPSTPESPAPVDALRKIYSKIVESENAILGRLEETEKNLLARMDMGEAPSVLGPGDELKVPGYGPDDFPEETTLSPIEEVSTSMELPVIEIGGDQPQDEVPF